MNNVVLQTVYVAGMSHLDPAGEAYGVALDIGVGDEFKLVRDPTNEHDKWAIKVLAHVDDKYVQIGWVPRKAAKLLAKLMDGGLHLYARVDALNELGQNVWIDVMWRRPFTEKEKARLVVKHAKRKRLDL